MTAGFRLQMGNPRQSFVTIHVTAPLLLLLLLFLPADNPERQEDLTTREHIYAAVSIHACYGHPPLEACSVSPYLNPNPSPRRWSGAK
jgi:hypothetical protein